MARGLDLDLVEVAPMANPPVCRIMDYGKFRYEEAQKAKDARKKSTNVTVKEVKFRPKIGKGDFDTKVRHLIEFIEEGHKVKVTLQFRGREMAHPELGAKILDGVIESVGPMAKVENQARLEGRSMSMVLAPDKKAQEAMKKAEADAEAEAQLDASTPDSATPNGGVVQSGEPDNDGLESDAEAEPADAIPTEAEADAEVESSEAEAVAEPAAAAEQGDTDAEDEDK
jgi:translation initiation factor IF-3